MHTIHLGYHHADNCHTTNNTSHGKSPVSLQEEFRPSKIHQEKKKSPSPLPKRVWQLVTEKCCVSCLYLQFWWSKVAPTLPLLSQPLCPAPQPCCTDVSTSSLHSLTVVSWSCPCSCGWYRAGWPVVKDSDNILLVNIMTLPPPLKQQQNNKIHPHPPHPKQTTPVQQYM